MTDALGRAELALAAGNRDEALEALLAAWRECRAPALEALIDAVSKDAARAWPPLPEDGFDAAWNAREKEVGPAGLAPLLPGLRANPKGSIPLRLRKLVDRGPDPRLGAALLAMIDDPPVTASSNFSMWTVLFGALPSMVDTRAVKRLEARAKKKGGDSNFWPKLTAWIGKAVKALPEPADLDPKRLAPLTRAAAALAKKAPEAKAAPVKAEGRALPVLKTLEHAAQGTAEAALGALLDVWAATRAVEVADAIDRLGHALSAKLPALPGKPADLHAAWMKLGKQKNPAFATQLIDALLTGKLADAEERMAVMLDWAPDPRVATKLALIIESAIGARPVLWKLCYELLVLHADRRVQPVVDARVKHLETAALFDRNRIEGPHARRAHEPFLAAAQGRALSAEEAQALAAVDAKFAAKKADTGREVALLRAIGADYAAEEPRQVYADFLNEQGDPRGEYVALALANEKPGTKLKGKLAASFKANQAALLGPLAPMKAFETVFERGLLHTYQLRDQGVSWAPGPAREALLTDGRWAQIHTLKFWAMDAASPGLSLILERAPLYALRTLSGSTAAHFAVMAKRDFPWKLERLHFQHWDTGDWSALGRLPSLRVLEVADFRLPPPGFLTAPMAADLTGLVLGHPDYGGASDVGGWLSAVADRPKLAVDLRCASVGFTRTGSDVALRIDARCNPTDLAAVAASLGRAPKGFAFSVTGAPDAVAVLQAALPK